MVKHVRKSNKLSTEKLANSSLEENTFVKDYKYLWPKLYKTQSEERETLTSIKPDSEFRIAAVMIFASSDKIFNRLNFNIVSIGTPKI